MKKYIDFLENNLVDFMMGINFHDFFEIGDRVVLGTGEHLSLLNFVHERGVTIWVGDDDTWLVGESVGYDDVVDFFKE